MRVRDGRRDASGDPHLGLVLGDYVLEEQIGQGGMGSVYAARHRVIGKRAAVKLLARALAGEPEMLRRFVNEARAVNEAGNEHVIDVFGFGTAPTGEPYFIMERCDGEDLRTRLERLRLLPWPQALAITGQVLDALVSAHRAGIVHRDLKPENIFLVPRGGGDFVKVLDFGIAKLEGGAREHATSAGVVLGTLGYMSPEQTRGGALDGRSDVFAVGTLLYEACAGVNPFEAATVPETLWRLREGELRPLHLAMPSVPGEVSAFAMKLHTRDPARRPTAAQALAELRQLGWMTDAARAPSGEIREHTPAPPEIADTLERAVGEVRSDAAGPVRATTRVMRATAVVLRNPMIASIVGAGAAVLGAVLAVMLVLGLHGATRRSGSEPAAPARAIAAAARRAAHEASPVAVAAGAEETPEASGNGAPPAPAGAEARRTSGAPPAARTDPAVRSIAEAELEDALGRLDLSSCRGGETAEVRLSGYVGRDGVPFEMESEALAGDPAVASCLKRLVELERFSPPWTGDSVELDTKLLVKRR